MKRFNGFSQVILLVVCSGVLAFGQAAATKDFNNADKETPATGKLTAQQLNTIVSQEATQNAVTYLASQVGSPLSGTWSGTVTDQGWKLIFSGSINSQDATLTESGVLKGKVASWQDSGTVGSDNFTGEGKASLTSSGEVNWDQQVEICNGCGWGGKTQQVETTVHCKCPMNGEIMFESQLPPWPGGSPFIASTQLSPSGSILGTNVSQETGRDPTLPTLTTIQEGSINFGTGAISYDSDTFTPEGSGGRPVGR